MTYGDKYKEVFGYYPEKIPCPEVCPNETDYCKICEFNSIMPETVYKEDNKNEEKEDDRSCDRRNLSPIDIYNYLRTADPCEYCVIFSIVFYKMSEVMAFEDIVRMTFANLFASSGSFDAEAMYKAQEMILNNYKGGVKK